MATIVLKIVDEPWDDQAKTSMFSDPAEDFMQMKLNEMTPAQQCAYMAVQAIRKLSTLVELQVDMQELFSKDPGFHNPNKTEVTYH